MNLFGKNNFNALNNQKNAQAQQSKPNFSLEENQKQEFEKLKNDSINTILERMERSLQIQSDAFLQKAQQIARWDRMIYDCTELIIHLENQLMKIDSEQKTLQQKANELLHSQNDFIEKMKNETSQTSHISGPEDQRDRLYRLAQHLSNKYSDIETQLKDMVDKIEKSRHLSEVSSDMDKISKITNCHINSLQWIANQSDDLEKEIEKLSNK